MNFKRLAVGAFEANCYILFDAKNEQSAVIDPGAEAERIMEAIGNSKVRYILITHGHGDHIGGVPELRRRTQAAVGIHPGDAKRLKGTADFFLEDGQILELGEESIRVLHTPGHTAGGVCFLAGKILFSGDTIFPNGHGNTDLPGADEQTILESIHRKIFVLADEIIIYPGHGPETTVGRERSTPFYPRPRSWEKEK